MRLLMSAIAIALLASTAALPAATAQGAKVFRGFGTAIQTGDCHATDAKVSFTVVWDYSGNADHIDLAWTSPSACLGATWAVAFSATCIAGETPEEFSCTSPGPTTFLFEADSTTQWFHYRATDTTNGGALIDDLQGDYTL